MRLQDLRRGESGATFGAWKGESDEGDVLAVRCKPLELLELDQALVHEEIGDGRRGLLRRLQVAGFIRTPCKQVNRRRNAKEV